jgi:Rieske Fe-S protein
MSPMNRRDFIKFIEGGAIVAGSALIAGPVVAYLYPKNLQETPSEPVLVCPIDELPVGESKTISYGRYPAIVINTSNGLVAYSAVCTHFACLVKWEPTQGLIYCPCHDGYFDPADGQVVSGPPPVGLTPLPVNVIENEIYVGGTA